MCKNQITIHVLIVLLFIFEAISQPLLAQSDKQNNLKINLLGPVGGYYSVFYERAIKEDKSLQFGLGYLDSPLGFSDNFFGSGLENSIRGFYTLLEYRFYLSKEGFPKGFFISPFARYQNLTLKSSNNFQGTGETNQANFNVVCTGLMVGSQWIFKDVITIDVWGGPEIYSKNDFILRRSDGSEALRYNHSPVLLRLGANIGFAF